MMKLVAIATLFALVVVSPAAAKTSVGDLERSACRSALRNPSTSDLRAYAKHSCMERLSQRGELERLHYRAKNARCTAKRVGPLTRAAGRLHKAKSKKKRAKRAKELRAKIHRSAMFGSCWKTMVGSI